MRVTRRILKKTAIASTAAAASFLVATAILFGLGPDYDYLIVIGFTIAVGPITAVSIIRNRWKNKIERTMPEFLRDLATSVRTGITITASLDHASKKAYGPLRDELEVLVAQMSWGMNLNDALAMLSKRVEIPLVNNATVLISEANTYGGDLSDVFDSTARYVEGINTWSLRRRTQTLPYVGIFCFSVGLFLFIIIMLSRMIFIPTAALAQNGVPFMKPVIEPVQARRIFLHASLLEALFGGLIAGKISDNSMLSGLKYSMILAIMSGIAFFLFFK